MPTGYTDGVMYGIITEFKDYAFQCARAFGALVTERDISVLEVGDYYVASLREAEEDLKRLSSMKPAQIEKEFLKSKAYEIRYHAKKIKDQEKTRQRYEKMIEKAKKFVAPTDEHVEYRDFLVSQLEESLSWDCGSTYHQEKLAKAKKKRSAKMWYKKELAEAKYRLRYAKKSLKEEIERIKSRNKWLSQLKKAVEEVK